ncbi:MAG: hypothetical protein NWF07_07265 [Candidatus Bathyarchaeota archaeon]|nr:hypothetical protein [Candidatus Bathyarchaeota archaeon]
MPNPIEELEQYLQENGLTRTEFHGTTYAWGFRENEPIIAYINEKDPGLAFQSIMSLYWASADYITKPWCLLVEAENIPPHQKGMLDNLASQYNIQLVSEETLFSTARKQLDNLVGILNEYIPENSENPLKMLGESIKGWRQEKPAKEYSYKVKIETGNLDIYKENNELTPNRKTIPLTATSGNNRVESILPRLVEAGETLVFDTEHRNLPMVYKLIIGEDSRIITRFEADKGNIIEATGFWGLYHAFNASKRLAFIEPNTGDILFNCTRITDDAGDD